MPNRSLFGAAALLALALSFAAPAFAATFLHMDSQRGDVLLKGESRHFTDGDGVFAAAVMPDGGVGVAFINRSGRIYSWNVYFKPAAGRSFGVGSYVAVNKDPVQYPGHPGMSIGQEGGCTWIDGSFKVLDLGISNDGTIWTFAADFLQYCDYSYGAISGGIRLNSDIPYVASPPPPEKSWNLLLVGDDGYSLLDGVTLRLSNDPAKAVPDYAQIYSTTSNGDTVSVAAGANELVTVSFSAPPGLPLAVGSYQTNQSVSASRAAGVPGMDFYMGHMGCGGGGRFTVRELERSEHRVERLAVDFESFCGVKKVWGGIRVNTFLPNDPPKPTGPVTTASFLSPSGGKTRLSVGGAGACTLESAEQIDPATANPPVEPPPWLARPHGIQRIRAIDCGGSAAFTIEFPKTLPPNAQWWQYGPTPDNRTSHWYPAWSPSIANNRLVLLINDADRGDDDLTANGTISFTGMIAVPGGEFQDLWWSGLAENGWGMSIVQHRDVLFANIFVYDAQGNPAWYVMPSGTWSANHYEYTGDLYLPKGSPYFAYDGSKFEIGASVGRASLNFFADLKSADFSYTIDGISGKKQISRLGFGPKETPVDKSVGDLWWAGAAQSGWGIALLQQYRSLFALWFTYDTNGKATWFVMPAGTWDNASLSTNEHQFDGRLYRPQGSAWLDVPYDASRHRTIDIGALRFRFGAATATLDYSAEGRSGSIPLSRIPF